MASRTTVPGSPTPFASDTLPVIATWEKAEPTANPINSRRPRDAFLIFPLLQSELYRLNKSFFHLNIYTIP
jgi:hypothetical protein